MLSLGTCTLGASFLGEARKSAVRSKDYGHLYTSRMKMATYQGALVFQTWSCMYNGIYTWWLTPSDTIHYPIFGENNMVRKA